MPWSESFAADLVELWAEETRPRYRGTPSDDAEQRLVDARARKLEGQREYDRSPAGRAKARARKLARAALFIAQGLTAKGEPRRKKRRPLSPEKRRARAAKRQRERRRALGEKHRETEREYRRRWWAALSPEKREGHLSRMRERKRARRAQIANVAGAA